MFCNIKGTKICILSGESQKGINTFQQCWVENQKGTITLPYFCTAVAPFWLSTEQLYSVNAILTLKWQYHLGLLCFRHQYNLIKLIPNLNSRVLVLKFFSFTPHVNPYSTQKFIIWTGSQASRLKRWYQGLYRGTYKRMAVQLLKEPTGFSHGEQNFYSEWLSSPVMLIKVF